MDERKRRRSAALAALGCLLVLACGRDVRTVRGVVHDVMPESGQVLIEHEEIPELMEAMTMAFPVQQTKLLDGLAPGQEIEFDLDVTGGRYTLVGYRVVGEASEEEGWVRFGDVLVQADPAPAFRLRDQAGVEFDSRGLRGRAVLLDFVFTSCPGPCPILTSHHVAVQRALSPSARRHSRFVSITLDPANDDPAALRKYAEERGAELGHWSFLTGPEAEVAALVRAFGVGSTRAADGTIEHMVVTFLIDGKGRIVKRYFGSDDDPAARAADIETLVAAIVAGAPER